MLIISMILTLVTIDQWTKYYISSNFNLYQSKPVIENFFHLTYITNDGMAFGLSFPGGKKVLFVIINLRLESDASESSDTLEVIFDNVEGIAANVVALYFFIELRISVALGFFCNTNVLPTYNEVWRHPNPKE